MFKGFQNYRTFAARSFFILILLTTAIAGQSSTPEFPDPGKTMSREDQQAIGKKVAQQVYEQMPVLPDSSPETQYIRQLGQKLVATIPPQYSWPFEFHVVAQSDINAFALPGGPMFVNIGTMTHAANEAQLAGVMAHEMSHVYMQHSAKQASKAQTTGIIAGIAGAVLGGAAGGGAGGLLGQLGQMGIQMTAQGLMLKYSRHDESQADSVGAIILYKAGYNPQAMADFFSTLEAESGGGPPQWLSDHPNPGNRQAAIQKEIRSWQAKNYQTDSAEFQQAREHAKGTKAYTGQEIAQGAKSGQWARLNRQNGAVFSPTGANALNYDSEGSGSGPRTDVDAVPLENVLPSSHMVTATLGSLRFQHPDNWLVKLPEKDGQFVIIAPRAGVTNAGVGYGVLLNGVSSRTGRLDIDQFTTDLVQQMKKDNAAAIESSPQPIMVGRAEGRSAMFKSASPFRTANGQLQPESDWLVVVPMPDGSAIFMIFVAPQSEFDKFRPAYEAMLRSIQIQ